MLKATAKGCGCADGWNQQGKASRIWRDVHRASVDAAGIGGLPSVTGSSDGRGEISLEKGGRRRTIPQFGEEGRPTSGRMGMSLIVARRFETPWFTDWKKIGPLMGGGGGGGRML